LKVFGTLLKIEDVSMVLTCGESNARDAVERLTQKIKKWHIKFAQCP
jgi:hypothetical protein